MSFYDVHIPYDLKPQELVLDSATDTFDEADLEDLIHEAIEMGDESLSRQMRSAVLLKAATGEPMYKCFHTARIWETG